MDAFVGDIDLGKLANAHIGEKRDLNKGIGNTKMCVAGAKRMNGFSSPSGNRGPLIRIISIKDQLWKRNGVRGPLCFNLKCMCRSVLEAS